MKYLQKRYKTQISKEYIAKLLGVNLQFYEEVEAGKRELKGVLLEKFIDIINNAKEIRYQEIMEIANAKLWIDENDVRTIMKDMGISSVKLADKLYASSTTINDCLSLKRPKSPYYFMIYDYLNDPVNQPIKKSKKEDNLINDISKIYVDEEDVKMIAAKDKIVESKQEEKETLKEVVLDVVKDNEVDLEKGIVSYLEINNAEICENNELEEENIDKDIIEDSVQQRQVIESINMQQCNINNKDIEIEKLKLEITMLKNIINSYNEHMNEKS